MKKKRLTWSEFQRMTERLHGRTLYWLQAGTGKPIPYGKIIDHQWNKLAFEDDPDDVLTIFLHLRLHHEGSIQAHSIDLRSCASPPIQMENGDIEFPYGVSGYRIVAEKNPDEVTHTE